jgi:hypothetical protein
VCDTPSEWGITDQGVIDNLRHCCPVITKMLNRGLVFDQNDPKPPGTGSGHISCFLDGVALPAYTVYDYFGWLLSIAARPRPAATSQNYYLPLLSCFANWCVKIANRTGEVKSVPVMVSIAVYKKFVTPGTPGIVPRAFLGVCIPDDRAFQEITYPGDQNFGNNASHRQTVMNSGRQMFMEQCGLRPMNVNQQRPVGNPATPFAEPEAGYGRCAETLFWVLAKE